MHPIKVNSICVNQIKSQHKNINVINRKDSTFQTLMHNEIHKNQSLKFSKHALERLQERKIDLTDQDLNKLNNAINKAALKGIKETLIIMDNKAFIASVKNRIVITAAADNQLKDNVFTNIDGAVFA